MNISQRSKFSFMGSYNSFLRSFSFLWLGSILASGLGVLFQIILAREFTAAEFGLFSAANGTVSLLAPLVGFGLASFWLKVFGEEGYLALRWIYPSFQFIAISGAGVLFLLSIWAYWGPHSKLSKEIILFLSITVLSGVFLELISAKFQLEGKFTYMALLQLVQPLSKLLIAVFIIYYLDGGILDIAKSNLLVIFITLVICVPFIKKLFQLDLKLIGHSNAKLDYIERVDIKQLVSETWVFGVGGVFYLLWSQSHIVLLKYLSNDHNAGLYGVIILLINAVCMLPNVLYSKLLMPQIHRWANHDLEKLKSVYYKGNKLMFLLGVLMSIFIVLFANDLVLLLFGTEYLEVVYPLIVFSLLLPIRFVGHSIGALLVAKTYMRLKVKIMGAVALFSLILNLIFIPQFSLWAVVFVTIISEIFLITMYYYFVRKYYIKADWL